MSEPKTLEMRRRSWAMKEKLNGMIWKMSLKITKIVYTLERKGAFGRTTQKLLPC